MDDAFTAGIPAVGKRSVNVLVVDDEEGIRTSVREFLRAEGYGVEVAADVEEAQHYLATSKVDVILSDIIMPEISGVEFLKFIRAHAPDVQVILMTARPTVETASEAVREGAADYLIKPVPRVAILRSVGNAARLKLLDDERRRLEAENQRHQQGLERLVDRRTAELSESNKHLEKALGDLTQAQAEMIRNERLNALAQLAAGICHDFNNVLMPIRGLSDFLLTHSDALDDRAATTRMLASIHSATDDASAIVKRMREFYHPREALETYELDLVPLVADVVELTRPKWQVQAQGDGRAIEVIQDVQGSPSITANEAQLKEVLTNLVLNAADAMRTDGTIRISAERQDGEMVIKVADDGQGMPDEIRKRCLEPFFTTKGDNGTGMGLAMVHGVVTRHGGYVDIDSELGKGTTIAVRLPARAPTKAAEHDAVDEEERELPPLKVLVIDDEEWSRSLIGKYLGESGHTVEAATDGMLGLEKALHDDFDFVITDKAMPGMNGDQVAAAIKRVKPELPVLMLTGSLMAEQETSIDSVDEVLEKPVTQRELIDAICRLYRP